ncbi:RdRP-domain-containing protein [Hypomontagnella monticulosa]|nr:RdRP-domain-containing protein [Hypomontagnella monticulosa]
MGRGDRRSRGNRGQRERAAASFDRVGIQIPAIAVTPQPTAGLGRAPAAGNFHPSVPPRDQTRSLPPSLEASNNQRARNMARGTNSYRTVGPRAPNPTRGQRTPRNVATESRPVATNARRPTAANIRYASDPYGSSNGAGLRPRWADWDAISLRVRGLPLNTTTSDLWSAFEHGGDIILIELFEKKDGTREGNARITFSPPPTKQFWEDRMELDIQGQIAKVLVDLMKERRERPVVADGGRSYPASLSVGMLALQFGVLLSETQLMPLRTVQKTVDRGFSLIANLRDKRLEVMFDCGITDPRHEDSSIRHPSEIGQMEHILECKTHIPFTHLKKIVFIDSDDTWALLVSLPSPPIFFHKGDYSQSFESSKGTWHARDAWNRITDVAYDTSWFKDEIVALPKTGRFIDIGRWTTYRLVFPKSALKDWERMDAALRDFNIIVERTTPEIFSMVPAQVSDFWQKLDPQQSDGGSSTMNLALLADTEYIYLPYDVRYQLEACISQGILNEVNITTDFLRKLADLSKDRTRRRDRAKDLLGYLLEPRVGNRVEDRGKLDERRIYDPMSLFEDKKAMSHYPEISLPEHCVWVRKVVVTPTTIYLSSPAPEPSNRILRQYSNYEDRFLRVQFTDEVAKGQIFSDPHGKRDNALFNRIYRTLQNGIRIGGRHFEYLASGNSQFREHSAYFFCPTDFLTCDNIRDWMGEVNHIRAVAKYNARLGQCFSTTRVPKASPIGQTIVQIKDIENDRWCFTDGVGKIAPSRAQFLMQNLNVKKPIKSLPSAFQFRLGGSKGILVQWPEVPFNEVHLRPSQNKFNAISKGLEIIKTSRFSVATLNRQTIIILSCLGVQDAVFEEMMKRQVAGYEQAMGDPEVAMRLLSKYVDQNGVTTTMAQMIADGFMHSKEPFVMTIMQVWRAWSMRLLREKARIVVDQGAFVFGCVDETRTLRGHIEPTESSGPSNNKDPNKLPQIFLQVPKAVGPGEQGEYTVITGICMLGRNPSLHPGDIRVVEAVDVPALRHIRDVVVFPAVGDRDIPSMCSGGDLDGDDYFVVWDPKLIPTEWNYPAMEHDALKPEELKRDVKVSDLISFFVTYIKNDSLSTIAHAHLAKSDALDDGPKDPQCIELAQLHSNAVDYPKTGRTAHLDAELRPRMYPHFMEKPPHKTYRSGKILGRLYDQVAKTEFKPNLNGAFDERILRRYAPKAETLKMIRMIKRQHDKAIRQIMNQYDIKTEFEVWSTFVLSKPRVGSEYKRQETMEPVMTNHRERFREACIKAAGSREPETLYPVIAATYYVTWEEVQIALREQPAERREASNLSEMPLISFPWVFESELGRIATSHGKFELTEMPEPTIASLDDYGDDDDDVDAFKDLMSAKLEDIEVESNGDGHGSKNQEILVPIVAQPTQPIEEESVEQEELVELEEDGETNMDALAKLMTDMEAD